MPLDESEDLSKNKNMEFDNWDEAPLKQNLLRGIYAYGFEHPSPIQKKSIIPMTSGKDIIAQAQSGTGKNRCFYHQHSSAY